MSSGSDNDMDSIVEDMDSIAEDMGNIQGEDDYKEQLQDCLDEIAHQGAISAFRNQKQYVNPGLHISRYGSVGLPLSTRDAQAIALLCKKSPFGRKDETVVDETVRKTWELDTAEFQCRNPAWTAYLHSLTDQAIQDLGVQVSASAQQYKLLLYEQGAFFKPHRDTEKIPGMFGTLVISLPSEHTGGDVRIVHGKDTRVLETAPYSAFDLSTLAWYSDVQHEIKPVTSGYRLVLTYNLVQDLMQPKQTAAAITSRHARLAALLRTWDSVCPYLNFLVYPLEHQYTESSLSLQNLKGRDAAKGRYFEALCAKNGIYWFLAKMTKETQSYDYDYDDDDDDDDKDESIQLSGFVTPAGRKIKFQPFFTVETNRLLADIDGLYDSRSPDSETEGDFTGNESMPATHRYHDTVVVLMRKDSTLKMWPDHQYHDVSSMLALFELIRNDDTCSPETRHSFITTILKKSLALMRINTSTGNNYTTYSYSWYTSPHSAFAEYAKIFDMVSAYCYENNMGMLVGELLQGATQESNWSASTHLVRLVATHMAKEVADGKEDVWSSWLSTPSMAAATYRYAKEQCDNFETVRQILPPASVPSFDVWKEGQLNTILRSVQTFSEEDTEFLVELLPISPPALYHETVLTNVEKNATPANLSRFLYALGTKKTNVVDFRQTIVKPTYQRLLQKSSALLKLDPGSFRTSRPFYATFTSTENLPDQFLSILDECMALDLQDEAATLLKSGLPTQTTPFLNNWESMLHFVELLVTHLQRYENNIINKTCRPFLSETFKSLAQSQLEQRPREPIGWERSRTRNCTCDPCKSVSRFLSSRTQKTGRFTYVQHIRSHIQTELGPHDYHFETEKHKTPHTLVVHKTSNPFTRNLDKWKSTCTAMSMQMRNLMTPFLAMVLEDYYPIIDTQVGYLGQFVAGQGTAYQPPLAHAHALEHAPRPITGVKRKLEIVDLTEDLTED